MTKVFLFGIDGASPDLIFEKWLPYLPNIKKVMQKGLYAEENTTIPPATIIAWTAMFSGKEASQIGVFNYTYVDKNGQKKLVSSNNVRCKRIWDILSEQNKKTISLYVPLTFPATKINGIMVSDFLTPSIESDCAYPKEIKDKLKQLGDTEHFFDVTAGLAEHKGLSVETLIERTYNMTDMQLTLARDLLKNEEWDLFICVMLGTDRLQHMLWRHFDETHRRFIKGSEHKNAVLDYYKYLDKKLGELLDMLDEDTVIIIASDHGMVKQEGKINLNNWLIQEGYLVLNKEYAEEIKGKKARLEDKGIDWEKTTAYGGGAYNARIYINRKKVKAKKDYDSLITELTKKLKAIPDDKGKPLKTLIFKSKDIYADTTSSDCPDLTIYFDELRWASNPDFGQEGLYSWETAVGADNAGHSMQGYIALAGPGIAKKGYIGEIEIFQVMPTILKLMGTKIPKDIKAKPIDYN